MKILQINKYGAIKGGTETVLFSTIKLLKDAGHEVVLFSTDEYKPSYSPSYVLPYLKQTDSTFRKIREVCSFFYNRKAAQELEIIINKEKPDVVHIHLYLNSFSVSILPVLKKYKLPVVMTLHEYRQICPSYLLIDKKGNICEKCKTGNYLNCAVTRCSKGKFFESLLLTMEMYYRRLFYKTEAYVDKFICVSNFVLKKHLEFKQSIADKSIVIHNPVRYPLYPQIIRGDYLLYFGRLSVEKGLGTLLKVMKQLPDIKLLVVGKGDFEPEEIPDNVSFVGFKSGDELESLIRNAMYTVVPSECYETFGLSCAESLSLGTPVIAANIGALPEMVIHKETGFLFAPKDEDALKAIISEALLLSGYQYREMCKEGYDSMKRFSEHKYVGKLLNLYKLLILQKL